MDRLLKERNTLNDLSMLDPLTGLYNRRGLQNRLDTILSLDGAGLTFCYWTLIISKPTTTTTGNDGRPGFDSGLRRHS